MTNPETVGNRIQPRGMIREHLMPADAENPCAIDINRDIFDLVIDRASHWGAGQTSGKTASYRNAVKAAKRICGGCPVREACLTVHGPDLELGVVAGATDQERAALFGGDAA